MQKSNSFTKLKKQPSALVKGSVFMYNTLNSTISSPIRENFLHSLIIIREGISMSNINSNRTKRRVEMYIKTFELLIATHSMLEEINNIYLKCRELLFENEILQWDDQYPNKEYFQQCIESNTLYVLIKNTEILGHVVLDEWQPEEWDYISWEGSKPIMIHSLMINPLIQGKGLGTEFVKLCEQIADEKGYDSIRLDAFSGNETAIHLYRKLGYQMRGNVFFTSKPEGHQEYFCFEKEL